VTIKSGFKQDFKLDASAKTKIKTEHDIKLRFKTKLNLNNPVLNLISIMHRDRRFFLKTSL